MRNTQADTDPIGYQPETVMTKKQLSRALSCSPDTLESSDLPVSYALGPQTPRYIWGDVVAAIRKAGTE